MCVAKTWHCISVQLVFYVLIWKEKISVPKSERKKTIKEIGEEEEGGGGEEEASFSLHYLDSSWQCNKNLFGKAMIVFRLTGFFAARVLLFPLSVRHLILCQIFLSLFADISEGEREKTKNKQIYPFISLHSRRKIFSSSSYQKVSKTIRDNQQGNTQHYHHTAVVLLKIHLCSHFLILLSGCIIFLCHLGLTFR